MSSTFDKLSTLASKTAATAASILKIAIKSRLCSVARHPDPTRQLVVLGNGPSLNNTVENHSNFLADKDLLAVNFAANAPMFLNLKPNLYVLADPHFFTAAGTDLNVEKLWHNIASVNWKMTLFVPIGERKKVQAMNLPANITIKHYNLTPIEGFNTFCRTMFKLGLGMPRPRNVLIPSIMLAIAEGYGKIFIAGADHSWTKTLWVDDNNHVVSIQPHFYEDNKSEKKRVASEYGNYHLHQILKSLYIAFNSYFAINDYARRQGTEILNITPDSFIDAFERLKL